MRALETVVLAGAFTCRVRDSDIVIGRIGNRSGESRRADQTTIALPGDAIGAPQRLS